MAISPELLARLEAIVGPSYISIDPEVLKHYGHDETEDLVFPPNVVVKPGSTQEIAELLKVANQFKMPVTPIGARTGLSGGALCVYEGIGLSMERLNSIIEIDEQNLQVTTNGQFGDRKASGRRFAAS